MADQPNDPAPSGFGRDSDNSGSPAKACEKSVPATSDQQSK
jgi:hypothetical protein